MFSVGRGGRRACQSACQPATGSRALGGDPIAGLRSSVRRRRMRRRSLCHSANSIQLGRVEDTPQVLDFQGTCGVNISTLPRCHRILHADRDPIGNVVAVPALCVRPCQRPSAEQASPSLPAISPWSGHWGWCIMPGESSPRWSCERTLRVCHGTHLQVQRKQRATASIPCRTWVVISGAYSENVCQLTLDFISLPLSSNVNLR